MFLDSGISETNPGTQNRHFNYFTANEDGKNVNIALFYVMHDDEVRYQIRIKKSDLQSMLKTAGDAGVPIQNTATAGGKTKPVTVTITGEIEQETPTDESLLKKGVINNSDATEYVQADDGNIEYYVYVNPGGKKISNTDTYDVVDDFILNGFAPETNDGKSYTTEEIMEMLDAGLLEISVEEIDNLQFDSATGKYTYTKVRSIGDFSYTVEERPSTTKIEDVVYDPETVRGSLQKYQGQIETDFKPGETVYISLKFVDPNEIGNRVYYTWDDERFDAHALVLKKESDGTYTCEITVPSKGAKVLKFDNWEHDQGGERGYTEYTVTLKDKEVTTVNASSRLTVTVPDETPLKITYKYKVTKEGGIFNQHDRFNASNRVSINTGNITSSDSLDDVVFQINNSGAEATTGTFPSIRKYNIGNSNSNLSGAKFYLAMYDGGGWKFVNNINTSTADSKTFHELSFSDTPISGEGLPETGTATAIELTESEPYRLTGSSLTTGKLYKIIEIKVPNGYVANESLFGTGKPYASLEALLRKYLESPTSITTDSEYYYLINNFISTHYFRYGTASGEMAKPEGFNKKVTEIPNGGTIAIPNNELISIGASKTWEDVDNDYSTISVELELLWSTQKQSNGIPDDAKSVSKVDLGLIDNIVSTREISGISGTTTPLWTNLPNGLNDKPIYYYVREIAYTVDDVKYEYDKTSGTYKSVDGKLGDYKPTYTGNALNRNGTVSITNSKGLLIQKKWVKRNGDSVQDMTESEIPATQIKCDIYGKENADSAQVLIESDVILTAEQHWQYRPSGEILKEYVKYDFIIIDEKQVMMKDSTTFEDAGMKLYGYVRSSTSNVTDGVGTATLINKDNTPSDVDISVEKVWADSKDHSSDSVEVTLYRSTTSLTDEQLGSLDISSSGMEQVTLVKEGEINPVTLNNSNKWTYTWNDLPYKDSSGQRYYYYVLETNVTISDGTNYKASYSVENNHTVITNSVPGSLSVSKAWVNQNGETINSTESVSLQLYRRAQTATSGNEKEVLKNYKVMAIGDSITDGSDCDTKYGDELKKIFEKNGIEGADVKVNGYPSCQIDGIIGQKENWQLDNTYNAVLLIAGTNNVLNTNQTVEKMQTEMESLINAIFDKAGDDVVLYIGKIPRILSTEEKRVGCGDKRGNQYNQYTNSDTLPTEQLQKNMDDLVKSYNDMLETLPGKSEFSGKTIKIVDTYTAVGDHLITTKDPSGIHPTHQGHENMAKYFYQAILNQNGLSTSSTTEINIDGLPEYFLNEDGGVNSLYQPVGSAFNLPDESGNMTKTFSNLEESDTANNLYVYYVYENDTGKLWTASYKQNGQTISSSGGIIQVTNTVETIDLNVEKQWNDSQSHVGDIVQFKLHRTTDQSKIPKQHMMFEIINEEYKDKTVEILQSGSVEITETVRTFSPIAQISELSEESQAGTWETDTNGGEVYSTLYEMKDSTHWNITIPNLPVKDSAGNAYYYWIEEVAVSGYEASYRYVDGDDTQNKAISSVQLGTDPKITITNTKKESSTTTMPSTGGNGAGKYYTVGGMLLMLSACGWAMRRRKRVIPH